MAKNDNIKDFCTDIADAIRRKEGSSDLISPMDFAQRIDNLQVGGGTNESSIEYLDVSGFPSEPVMFLSTYSILCRVLGNAREGVLTTAIMMQNPTVYSIKYIAIDFSLELLEGKTKASIKDALIAQGMTQADIDAIPRLTKEQFYDLNA